MLMVTGATLPAADVLCVLEHGLLTQQSLAQLSRRQGFGDTTTTAVPTTTLGLGSVGRGGLATKPPLR